MITRLTKVIAFCVLTFPVLDAWACGNGQKPDSIQFPSSGKATTVALDGLLVPLPEIATIMNYGLDPEDEKVSRLSVHSLDEQRLVAITIMNAKEPKEWRLINGASIVTTGDFQAPQGWTLYEAKNLPLEGYSIDGYSVAGIYNSNAHLRISAVDALKILRCMIEDSPKDLVWGKNISSE